MYWYYQYTHKLRRIYKLGHGGRRGEWYQVADIVMSTQFMGNKVYYLYSTCIIILYMMNISSACVKNMLGIPYSSTSTRV